MKKFLLLISSIIIINGAFLYHSGLSYGLEAFQNSIRRDLDAQKLRPEIRAILKDPRFIYHDSFGWLKSLINKISRPFRFKPLPQTASFKFKGSKFLVTGLKVLGILVLILLPLLIAYLGNRFMLRDWRPKTKQNQVTGERLNSGSLKRTASSMAKAGQYREAIRYLYLAGLEKLKEEDLLSQGVKYSDKENLKNLRAILGEEDLGYIAFHGLTGVFQEKWYGLKECGLSDYRLAENELERVYSIKTPVIY